MFARAAAWDAPLMMDRPNKYGMGPIFGTQENFEKYQISSLLAHSAAKLGPQVRLIHFGYGNFREQHESAERLLNALKIPHEYRDGPQRDHSWTSGWLPEAVEMLAGK
jgi:acetyl esterase/lipase